MVEGKEGSVAEEERAKGRGRRREMAGSMKERSLIMGNTSEWVGLGWYQREGRRSVEDEVRSAQATNLTSDEAT